jgi:soluble lytic murein transglycosylase-like protein
MRSRRSSADSSSSMRVAARSCVAACTVLVTSGQALADSIRYVDRNGRVHEIVVRREETPPAPPVAAPTTSPTVTQAFAASVPYIDHVREAAKLYSLPIELVAAVMRIESGGNPNAVSIAGAMGLMQLMPGTADDMGVDDPYDPRKNLFGGARYLRILINMYDGSVAKALAAYHAGSATVEKYGGIPPYPDTRKYITEVIKLYHRYQEKNAAPSPPNPPIPTRSSK